MKNDIYLSVRRCNNDILITKSVDGKKIILREKYQPSLFIPSNKKSQYCDIYGNFVEKMCFSTIRAAKDFVEKYSSIDNFEILGNQNFEYCWISDSYSGQIFYDISHIRILNFDIEVASDQGFPEPGLANNRVLSISAEINDKYYVLGLKDFETSDPKIKYRRCDSERELLVRWVEFWSRVKPDIITGYFINSFDVPYLINRIEKVLGDEYSKRFSPFNYIQSKTSFIKGKEREVYDIYGVAALDMFDLYQKFVPGELESNSLNFVAHKELGEKKLDYSEFRGLSDLYEKDHQKFILYNIRDVELVKKIERKKGLIAMCIAMAYDAKVNFQDVFSQTRLWDSIIYNYLRKDKIAVPFNKDQTKGSYPGAYVKEPVKGVYSWVISYDINSEYPMSVVQYNISPETLRDGFYQNVSVDDIIKDEFDSEILVKNEVSLTASGHCFDIRKRGFLPDIINRMYEDRVRYKKALYQSEQNLEMVNREITRRGISN